MYVDYNYYVCVYGQAIPETDFQRFSWEACRKLDLSTTGIDGVRKLKAAFPTDEDNAEVVRRCVCKMIDIMYQIQEAAKMASQSKGYVETVNGLRGKVISSVSAGNESISYSVNNSGTSTVIEKALADKTVQEQLYKDIIIECLSGISDANGVNLLYMGRYPYRLENKQ